MFTDQDLESIKARGTTPERIEEQIQHFIKGFPFAQLEAPATKERGIWGFDEVTVNRYLELFDKESPGKALLKFVPASGAASRMFSQLFAFREALESTDDIEKMRDEKKFSGAFEFIDKMDQFAFYPELLQSIADAGADLTQCAPKKKVSLFIEHLLFSSGLSYSSLPKGLLTFHAYPDGARKAVEEHLVEGAHYCVRKNGEVHIHFTLSPEHIAPFNDLINKVVEKYEKGLGVKYRITHSIQEPSTDTLAVDMDNQAFRESDGSLVFRPGGHGALLANLQAQDAEIVFVKNIDNIVPDRLKPETVRYKKLIGGLLIEIQNQCFQFLNALEKGVIKEAELSIIEAFCTSRLNMVFPETYPTSAFPEKVRFLFQRLHRPIRVCGMVKNEGEPGGGPFLVKSSNGEVSLQIVESSQVNLSDVHQKDIFNGATHFNPVDLVCGLKDFRGNKFDLNKFVDPETGFISIKTKDGRQLKALELPGLWNGAMANWITVFVEVPILTFNPVKTVNDLLRKEHLPGA